MRASELRLLNPEAERDHHGELREHDEWILDIAEDFMRVQAGHVSHAIGGVLSGNEAWRAAYRAALDREYAELLIHIRDRGPLLDIGGGMGAIDAMLYAKGVASTVTILDGWDDQPKMVSHDQPFSNAEVARRFLTINGVADEDLYFIDARRDPQEALRTGKTYQNVISLRSWCFHYAPAVYAQALFGNVAPGGTVIVDVRKGKEWEADLSRWFGAPKAVVHEAEKYRRMVFRK